MIWFERAISIELRSLSFNPIAVFIQRRAIRVKTSRTFARLSKIPLPQVYVDNAAAGRILCGSRPRGRGLFSSAVDFSCQLTVKNDVITSARHGFMDAPGGLRFNGSGGMWVCYFLSFRKPSGAFEYSKIDLASLAVGSAPPSTEQKPGGWELDDWAVAKLERPVFGVTPFEDRCVVDTRRRHKPPGLKHDGPGHQ
jgi:hypothetical protein